MTRSWKMILSVLVFSVLFISVSAATIFEDGFETGDLSKWTNRGGTPQATSGDAVHGTYKAVLNNDAGNEYAQAYFASVDQGYMRSFVQLKNSPDIGVSHPIMGLYSHSGGGYLAEVRVANVGGTLKWMLQYRNGASSVQVISDQEKPVLDTWYCVEIKGKVNSATDSQYSIYINGNELSDITQTGKSTSSQIDGSYIWASSYVPGSPVTRWYDDVVVSDSYIGPSYELQKYTLTVDVTGDGSVTIEPDLPQYDGGTSVTLTAIPSTHWYLDHWSGDASGSGNPLVFRMNGVRHITAVFQDEIFRDGFETGDFSKWYPVAGNPTVTSGEAHQGDYKAVLTTASQYAQVRFSPQDHVNMRAYVMFKSFPATGQETTVLGLYNLSGIYMADARVRNVAGTVKWALRYYDNGVHDTVVSEMEKPVLNTWYSVEVETVAHTTTSAESKIFINGNELADIRQTGKNNNYPVTCGYIWANSAITRWYDCIIVDTEYIGPKPAISNYVWEDLNGDGIQDTGEAGVSGVTVELYTCGDEPGTDDPVMTTTTDVSGNYLFEVAPGNYFIRFFAPDGYIFTQQDSGTDDAVDSDADPATGVTACTEITSGERDLTWDAGIQQADPQIDIVKKTNDADCAGYDDAKVYVGDTLTWTYTVKNTGNVPLSEVSVTDDKLGEITCPKTTLAVDESMTCTSTGKAAMGAYTNTATASGTYTQGTFTRTDTVTDDSCYFGTSGATIAGLGYTTSPYNTGGTNFASIKKGTWFMYLTVSNDIADGATKTFDLQMGTPKTGLIDVGDVDIARSGTSYTVTYSMNPTANIKGYDYGINVIDEHLGIDYDKKMSFTGSPGTDDNGDFGVPFTDNDGYFFVFPHFSIELGPTPV